MDAAGRGARPRLHAQRQGPRPRQHRGERRGPARHRGSERARPRCHGRAVGLQRCEAAALPSRRVLEHQQRCLRRGGAAPGLSALRPRRRRLHGDPLGERLGAAVALVLGVARRHVRMASAAPALHRPRPGPRAPVNLGAAERDLGMGGRAVRMLPSFVRYSTVTPSTSSRWTARLRASTVGPSGRISFRNASSRASAGSSGLSRASASRSRPSRITCP